MKTSNTINKISADLVKVMAEVKDVVKNSSGYGYKYASLDEVLKMVRPIAAKNNIAILQSSELQEGIVKVETTLLHSSGEYIVSEVQAPYIELKGMNSYQSLGAAITYLRRYSLSNVFAISSEEDTDAVSKQDNYSKPQNNPQQPNSQQNSGNGNVDLKTLGIEIIRENNVLVPREITKGAIFNNKNTLKQLGFKWNSQMKRWEKTA
jgi:hypothetical protein